MSKTFAQRKRDERRGSGREGWVTKRECASMRLLARDGWTAGELKMCFHLSTRESVRHHVEGDCAHDIAVSHLNGWDGKTAPSKQSASKRGIPDDHGLD